MALTINTNVSSLTAQSNLSRTERGLNRSLERLSSGLRINSARDDAAGLAIANRLKAQIGGLRQAVRNANDGISLAQTAEGALQETTNILLRMRDLAVQSANDTNDATDRVNIQKEISQQTAEINRIASTTRYSGKNLLNGDFTSQSFQVGAFAGENITFSITDASATAIGNNTIISGGTIEEAISGTNNAIVAQTLTVSGNLGSSTVGVAVDASAQSIVTSINGTSAATGVSASAVTTATLSSLSAGGTISFGLQGDNATSVTVSGSVTTTDDLSNILDSVNANTATTGISATFGGGGSDKSSLTLTHNNGADIKVDTFANSTGGNDSMNVTGASGAAVTLTEGGVVDGTVGGRVTFAANDSFTVNSTDGTTLFDNATNSSSLSAVASIDVSTQTGSTDALAVIDTALGKIDDVRATLGAVQNRLVSTINNLTNVANNQESALSQIVDADFAKETAELTKNQILQQAGISILSQANAKPQTALALLQ